MTGTLATPLQVPNNGTPGAMTLGPDGNVWVGENGASPNMTRLVPSTGAITAFPVPVISAALTSYTAGPDGNIWFVAESANRIGRIKL